MPRPQSRVLFVRVQVGRASCSDANVAKVIMISTARAHIMHTTDPALSQKQFLDPALKLKPQQQQLASLAADFRMSSACT